MHARPFVKAAAASSGGSSSGNDSGAEQKDEDGGGEGKAGGDAASEAAAADVHACEAVAPTPVVGGPAAPLAPYLALPPAAAQGLEAIEARYGVASRGARPPRTAKGPAATAAAAMRKASGGDGDASGGGREGSPTRASSSHAETSLGRQSAGSLFGKMVVGGT
eukprot:187062-Chlamydomonas_euryale.AAC.1